MIVEIFKTSYDVLEYLHEDIDFDKSLSSLATLLLATYVDSLEKDTCTPPLYKENIKEMEDLVEIELPDRTCSVCTEKLIPYLEGKLDEKQDVAKIDLTVLVSWAIEIMAPELSKKGVNYMENEFNKINTLTKAANA